MEAFFMLINQLLYLKMRTNILKTIFSAAKISSSNADSILTVKKNSIRIREVKS